MLQLRCAEYQKALFKELVNKACLIINLRELGASFHFSEQYIYY